MVIHFQYTEKDFQQAAKVQSSFLAGKKSAGGQKPRRGLLGWIVFAALAIVAIFLFNPQITLRNAAVGMPSIAAPEQPTQNFLLALVWAAIPPLFLLALLSWALSKPASVGRVPLYTPRMPTAKRWRRMLGCIALFALLAEIGAIIAFVCLPPTPDWRPSGMQLFLISAAPWFIWLFLWSFVSRLWQKCVRARQFHDESSTRLPHELEATDAHVVISTDFWLPGI